MCPEVTSVFCKNSVSEIHVTPKLVHPPAFDDEIITNDQHSPTLLDFQSSPLDDHSSPTLTSSPSCLEKTIKINKGTAPLGTQFLLFIFLMIHFNFKSFAYFRLNFRSSR